MDGATPPLDEQMPPPPPPPPEETASREGSPLRDSTGIPKDPSSKEISLISRREKGHKRTASADLKLVAAKLKPSLKKNLSDAPISKELNERARSAPLVKKFNLPPTEPLINDFSAALLKHILIHGRLYVSQNYICFESKIFGIKTMEVIPFKDVTVLTKKSKKLNITRGIEIATPIQTYYFASFVSRVKTFSLLMKIWREHVPKTDLDDDEDDDDDDEADYESDDSSLKKRDKKLMKENTDANLHKLANSIEVEHMKEDKGSRRFSSPLLHRVLPNGKSVPNINASTGMMIDPPSDLRDSNSIPNIAVSSPAGIPPPSQPIPIPSNSPIPHSDVLSSAPQSEDEEDDTNYDSGDGFLGSEAVYQPILTQTFNCSVKGFFKVFFSDESHFTHTYREHRGDKDVTVKKWTNSPQFGMIRDVLFISPVKVPLGPSQTRATETQRYHLSKSRLLIDTVTNFLDIPYGDSFRIEGKWDVVPASSPETCKLVVSIGVHFMKKTWFKNKIETQTIKETKESFQQWGSLATTEVAKAHKNGSLLASTLMPLSTPSSPLIARPSGPLSSTSPSSSSTSLLPTVSSPLVRSTSASSTDPSPPAEDTPPSASRRRKGGEKEKAGEEGRFAFIGRALSPLAESSLLTNPPLSPQLAVILVLAAVFIHMYLRVVYLEGRVSTLESILQPLITQKLEKLEM